MRLKGKISRMLLISSLTLLCLPKGILTFWLTDLSLSSLPAKLSEGQPLVGQLNIQPVTKIEDLNASRGQLTISANQSQSPGESGDWQTQCQCNSSWIKNQTDYWMSKWLHEIRKASSRFETSINSSHFAITNSKNLRRPPDANQSRRSLNGNNINDAKDHWSAWVRPKAANNNGLSITQNIAKASNKDRSHHNHHSPQEPQFVRGERGPKGDQGPRGEKGERGERGEAGPMGPLMSVKDRDSLFDLAPTTSDIKTNGPLESNNSSKQTPLDGQQSQAQASSQLKRQLVFIEAEQMLVVNTDAGWQPIQLLSPLRDFRTSIPKFTLTSPAERRRLMSSENMDNSIRSIMRHDGQNPTRVSWNKLDGVPLVWSTGDTSRRNDDFDQEEDADDDDEEDDGDDDDDDNDDDIDDEIVANEIEIDDADDDDANESDDSETSNKIANSSLTSRVAKTDKENVVDDKSNPRQHKARFAQVSSRSAISSSYLEQNSKATNEITVDPVSSSKDNSIKLRIVALNEPFSGNTHGIRGADLECKRNAIRARIKGSFRAMLASGYQNLNDIVRFNANKLPVVNLRGETLADSWNDLFKRPARTVNPLSRIYSFDGRHVATDSKWPNKLVWHGAVNKLGMRDSQHNCEAWHSDSLSKFGFASPIHPRKPSGGKRKSHKRRFAGQDSSKSQEQLVHQTGANDTQSVFDVIEKFPCRMPLIVLCIETAGQKMIEVSIEE